MQLIVKHFSELSSEELYEIYKLRVSVFVVEQNCPYQEVDETDKIAHHLFFKDETGIQAYLRLYMKDAVKGEAMIGRVIAVKRKCGMGAKIVQAGLRTALETLHAHSVVVEAQTYAKGFYEKQGFVQTSGEFMLDSISHVHMRYEP